MKQPLICILDINTKDALREWLRNFRHGDDIFVDIDGYRIEFTVMDSKEHSQRMTMPSIYSECGCCMYKIKDLLEEQKCSDSQ